MNIRKAYKSQSNRLTMDPIVPSHVWIWLIIFVFSKTFFPSIFNSCTFSLLKSLDKNLVFYSRLFPLVFYRSSSFLTASRIFSCCLFFVLSSSIFFRDCQASKGLKTAFCYIVAFDDILAAYSSYFTFSFIVLKSFIWFLRTVFSAFNLLYPETELGFYSAELI